MIKTFSKVLAVILALCVLLTLPVIAGAEDASIKLSNGSVAAVYGDWNTDYVESVVIEVRGDVSAFASDVIVTVGAGDSSSNIKTVAVSDASYEFTSKGSVKVLVPFYAYFDHGETYNFCFPAGTFMDEDGNLSEEYTLSVSGNAIIEKLDVEEVPVTPIQKLIIYLSGLNPEGFWKKALDFLIAALNWFVNI